MSNGPASGPTSSKPTGPLVPPLPSRAKRGQRPGKSHRGLWWALALALGVGAGVAGYQWVPNVDTTFDYWLAIVLG